MGSCIFFGILIFSFLSITGHTDAQGGIIIIEPTTVPPVTSAPPATNAPTVPTTTTNSIVIVNPAATTTPCQCTPTANCADGSGAINPRIVTNPNPVVCPAGQVYCCNLIALPTTAAPTTTTTTISPATCGLRPVIPTSYVPTAGQATFAEYPYLCLIYRVADGALIGHGVLLDANTVLTAAHKVIPGTQAMRVRLGEYILNAATEPNPFVEIAVSATRIHAAYNAPNLLNDIAILKLATAVNFATNPHIRSVCLPAAGASFSTQRCWVAGFGATTFTSNQYQNVMREVDVPVLDGPTCQTRFAASRLGATFVFNQQSFICAGGEAGRDACTGDGGAGLVCLSGTTWVLAGIVSWGLECGLTNVPGAYVNIANYLTWIAANRA